jgi:hypothetical protein
MAFRLSQYADLVVNLQASGRPVRTVVDFLLRPDRNSIVLRHDVDRNVGRAVRLAELENRLGICSSFYFRRGKNGFPVTAIREMAAMGHETGFHYQTLSIALGDAAIATELFLRQLSEFRKIASCQTICAHGKPMSPWFNGDIATELVESASGIIGDASASMPVDQITYLTDAGGRWNSPAVNLRDRVGSMLLSLDPLVSQDLAQLLECEVSLYISTHPERWCASGSGYLVQVCIDTGASMVKTLLRVVRA